MDRFASRIDDRYLDFGVAKNSLCDHDVSALASGRPRCGPEDQYIRDNYRPRPDEGPVCHPRRGAEHLYCAKRGGTSAEVRRYEDGGCSPSQTICEAGVHRELSGLRRRRQ